MLRRFALAALAAVVLVALLGLPTFADGGDAYLRGTPSAWKRVATTGLPDTPNFATVIGDRFVVLLDLPEGGYAPFTAENGRRWRRVDVPPDVFPSDALVQALTAGTKGIVAVGSTGPDDQRVTAFWRSTNGTKWSRSATDPSVFGGPGANAGVNGVTQGANGFVAVGYDGTGNALDAAVWTSPDAADWKRVTPSGDLVLGSQGEQGFVMLDVAYPRGTYVAVGFRRFFDAAGRRNEEPAVWTSRDGRTWIRRTDGVATPSTFSPDATGASETVLKGVVPTRGGFAAIGNLRDSESDRTMAGFVLFSASGNRWTIPRADGGRFALTRTSSEETVVRYVASTGSGAVVSGITRRTGSLPSTARIWVTNDGRTWRTLKGPMVEGYVEGPVLGAARGVVVLGYPFASNGSPTVAWSGGAP